MASRLELHEKLCELLGSRNVYYQPPESIKMGYPAIVYSKSKIDVKHANNKIYNRSVLYTVTVIDRVPDNPVIDKIMELPYCSYDRYYAADNLNHDILNLYY